MTVETVHPPALPLSKIEQGTNPRRYFDQAKHDELVASLKLRGMLQPILVRFDLQSNRHILVAGGRRHRAAVEAFGPDAEVPVIVREMSDQEALEAAIDENDCRDDASETEQADAAVRVLAACQDDRAEAARRLGWSTTKLDRRLALANLSEPVKVALDERRIKVGHAELLAAVPGDKQDKALETILGADLDVGKTRSLLMMVTQNLGAATFDKTECATCPSNSALQRALFETHVEDGHCTNPGCFKLKTEAAGAAAAAESSAAEEKAPAAAAAKPASTPSPTAGGKPTVVTAASIAGRATEFREAAWRNALGQMLAGNGAEARTVVLIAAMSGTLSQIKTETLIARAGVMLGESFPGLDFKGKIAAMWDLAPSRETELLSSIAAAYARDVRSFDFVAELARVFEIDVRDCWQVDAPFLGLFNKDELKFVAQECGLVSHMGAKAFAKLLEAKKDDIVAGMLNATGFAWAGRLPSAMALDGKYSAAPAAAPTPAAKD